MLPYETDAIQALTTWIDPGVAASIAKRGPWSTMVKISYPDYETSEVMLAVEVADRIRRHARAEITVWHAKAEDFREYIERMEA